MMKRVIVALLLCLPFAGFAQSPLKTNFDGCSPKKTIFFAYTADHKKAVEFCVIPGAYRYTYGRIGKPDITITAPPGMAGSVTRVNQEGVIRTGFAIRKGDNVYLVQHGPKEGDAKLMVNKREGGRVIDIALVYLEDKGWGFVDTTAETDDWPVFEEQSSPDCDNEEDTCQR